jgi:glucans biosynthesis protein
MRIAKPPLAGRSLLFVLLTVGACLLAAWGGEAPAQSEPGFSFAIVQQRARQRAATEYRPEPNRLPQFLKSLGYDGYQRIRFRPETGPWEGQSNRFTLQFFHPGYLYQNPLAIHVVEQGRLTDFQFSPAQFDYGTNQFPKPVPPDLQFAGLRVLYPLNTAGKQDEAIAFLGASYFRLIGVGERYGASARGLAIDTAESTGEEFPCFVEFWIERPPRRANRLELFALLDSPSAAGAYRFLLQPGEPTVLEVEGSLFLRKAIRKLGLAPLTSMFLMGTSRTRFIPDFRPQVHDSDGLLIKGNAGEWLWRPLANPNKEHHVARWPADGPKGFGLLQRRPCAYLRGTEMHLCEPGADGITGTLRLLSPE